MKYFRAKHIYLILLFWLCLCIFWIVVIILFLTKLKYLINGSSTALEKIGIILGCIFIVGYLALISGHMTMLLRYGLVISDNRIFLHDKLLFRKNDITPIVKGYSRTQFGNFQNIFSNTLIIYLTDRRKINIPKFLYLNFRDIESALIESKVQLLGDEPFKWKNAIQREYHYD
jgi:hypothetical protein